MTPWIWSNIVLVILLGISMYRSSRLRSMLTDMLDLNDELLASKKRLRENPK